MMALKNIKYAVSVAVFVMLALSGCRTNNGDIGPYYGLWLLQSLKVDNHEDTSIDCSKFSFRFQNNIVLLTEQRPYNEYLNIYGTWEERQGHLLLNFTHSYTGADGKPTDMDPPAEIFLQPRAVTDATVKHLNGKTMTLQFTTPDGKAIEYLLKKLN